jgi:signal peptidase II
METKEKKILQEEAAENSGAESEVDFCRKRRGAGSWLVILMTIAALVAFDQFTKYLAVRYLSEGTPNELLPGVLSLTYLENRGAAFSILQNQQWFFCILTTVFLILAAVSLYRLPQGAKYRPLTAGVALLTAGAVGNFIDRIVHRYVVDFIYFELINFPVFNVADIYVSVSVIAMCLLMLFVYKDEDLMVLFGRTQKKKNKEA